MKCILAFIVLAVAVVPAGAQDTSKRKEVNITSTFKPTLKEAAKINFSASPASSDTTRPRLQYNIPNQNLSFAFQPGSLKPLALQVDTGGRWDNESYVKAGYGNLKTPFVQAGLSFGDGKTMGVNVYAKHSSSKGKIPLQNYSNSIVDLNAFFQSANNLQWDARFGGYQENYNKYGFEPKTLSFPSDSTDIKYQGWRARLGAHNINRTALGLSYAPELRIDIFHDQLSNSESNTYLNLPVQKTLGEVFEVDVALAASLSRYKPENKSAIANNYFTLSPSLVFKKPTVWLQAGLRPSWDNNEFKVLPNLMAEFNTSDKRFAFQLGWTADLRNSGFQYSAGFNPWIWAPANVYNTRIEERYAGFKGSAGDHFSYAAKAAYNLLYNQPLFVNDTFSGKSFLVVNEPRVRVANFGGELGYTAGEKFSLISNLSFNQYKLDSNARAWGLLPLEWKTTMRLQVLKDLYVNSTLYAFDGPWALTRAGTRNLGSAMDLSAGLEFGIVPNIKLWAQFNNIFNKEYQRWNQYPVYGFNFLGGVVFSFAQKN